MFMSTYGPEYPFNSYAGSPCSNSILKMKASPSLTTNNIQGLSKAVAPQPLKQQPNDVSL